MWDLGEVVGVLLDPPSQGHALLREEANDVVHAYQAAWQTERALQPGRWYLRRQAPPGHATITSDGTTQHSFHGLKLTEQSTGRPDYWPPPLHLMLPLKAWFWGRSGDDWRMLPDVRTEQELAIVQLSHMEHRDQQGRTRGRHGAAAARPLRAAVICADAGGHQHDASLGRARRLRGSAGA
jgi:hypothetical protein